MTSEDLEHQAAAFLEYLVRRGGSWEEAFAVWAGSKEFRRGHRDRIRQIAHELLFSNGTTTEPPSWAA